MWNLTPSFAICTGTVQKGEHLATRGLCADRWDQHILICTCTAKQPKYILNTVVGMFSSRCRQLMENCAQLVISGNVFLVFAARSAQVFHYLLLSGCSAASTGLSFPCFILIISADYLLSLCRNLQARLGIFKGLVFGCTPWTQCFSHWWMGFKRCD